MKPQPNVVGAHRKKIQAAAAKLERRHAQVAEALAERDAAIFAAFDAGLSADQFADEAGMTKYRAWQLNKARKRARFHEETHENTGEQP